ncbi:MAG TPA: SUF system Fe-S cluster assembly protein [Chromatiales bacterium]|nr:SUF system Fe-S cluster assembly protein [Chromatiales bacterium]
MFKLAKLAKRVNTGKEQDAVPHDIAALQEKIIAALRKIHDPEISVNIYDLGLIYDINIDTDHHVKIDMTLTAPACPVAGTLPGQVEEAVRSVEGVSDAQVKLVWEPPWTQEKMSDEAKLELGIL